MRRTLPLLLPLLAALLSAISASAQTITGISPAYGGAGISPPGSYTITGTGFPVNTPKAVRFVDANDADVFYSVTCTTSTSCTADGVRPYRVARGTVSSIELYALINGVKSLSFVGFLYYGEPVVNAVVPNVGAADAATPYEIDGGPWTNNGSLPGVTRIQLGQTDYQGFCSSSTTCLQTATPPPAAKQGAYLLGVGTPGGWDYSSYFYFGSTPATPAITSVSPSSGSSLGGTNVTVTGANFIPGNTVFYFGSRSGSFTIYYAATGVTCSSPTTCTMTTPNGSGIAAMQVSTTCPVNSPFCGGSNPRASQSVTVIQPGMFAYPGVKTTVHDVLGALATSENGGTTQYGVSLTSQPAANVSVAVSVDGGFNGVLPSPTALVFTPQNWATPQTVTLTGTANAAAGSVYYSVANSATSTDASYNGLTDKVNVLNTDNATKNYVVTPLLGLVTTRAGGTATFTVALSAAPSGPVTMSFASGDPQAGSVSPSSVTFDVAPGGATGYNVPRQITVTGQNDGWPGRSRDYAILITTQSTDATYGSSTALLPPDVGVTNVDAVTTAPAGLRLKRVGPGAASVNWTLVAGADYYKIKYSTTPGGAKTLVASSGFPGHVVTGLTIGQPYYFVISSVSASGETADSAEFPFREYPPGAIDGFDGDLRSDMTYVTSAGVWHILDSTSGFGSGSTASLGGAGFTPVPGDYDGDQRNDVAVYNTATGVWTILTSSSNNATSLTIGWGGAGYLPVPGDYDGDGRTDPAVYRLSDGQWSALLSNSNYTTTISRGWGGGGYTPVPALDFDGDGKADLTIYSQAAGTWYVLKSSTNYTTVFSKAWGGRGYTLVPGDYDGDGKPDLGLYQRSTGTWSILLSGANYTTTISKGWGGLGYLPIPLDFDGDGKTDLGVFQQATGNWYALLSTTAYTTTVSASAFGSIGDRVISPAIFVGGDDATRASDWDGDGKADIAVYRIFTGAWATLTSSSGYTGAINKVLGAGGYTPVPGDYDGDGKVDVAVYENSTGNWTVLLSSTNFTTSLTKSAGGNNWIPVPADYDGDGKTDFVAYNQNTGQWFGLTSGANYTTTVSITYGGIGYSAVPADFDGDGRTDIAVYLGNGDWSVLLSSTNYTTSLTRNVGGAGGWRPVPADYDGDGKADFVVYNNTTGIWYGLKSSSNYTTTLNLSWGGTGYVPVKGDFDGDGKADLAVYVQPTGNFYILLSSSNYTTTIAKALGGNGYLALPQYP